MEDTENGVKFSAEDLARSRAGWQEFADAMEEMGNRLRKEAEDAKAKGLARELEEARKEAEVLAMQGEERLRKEEFWVWTIFGLLLGYLFMS